MFYGRADTITGVLEDKANAVPVSTQPPFAGYRVCRRAKNTELTTADESGSAFDRARITGYRRVLRYIWTRQRKQNGLHRCSQLTSPGTPAYQAGVYRLKSVRINGALRRPPLDLLKPIHL